jgi:hypothetical protein
MTPPVKAFPMSSVSTAVAHVVLSSTDVFLLLVANLMSSSPQKTPTQDFQQLHQDTNHRHLQYHRFRNSNLCFNVCNSTFVQTRYIHHCHYHHSYIPYQNFGLTPMPCCSIKIHYIFVAHRSETHIPSHIQNKKNSMMVKCIDCQSAM